jgi:hypothetical protein
MKKNLVIIGSGLHANSIHNFLTNVYQKVIVIDDYYPNGKVLSAVGGLDLLEDFLITS